jgi:hypothetical protein
MTSTRSAVGALLERAANSGAFLPLLVLSCVAACSGSNTKDGAPAGSFDAAMPVPDAGVDVARAHVDGGSTADQEAGLVDANPPGVAEYYISATGSDTSGDGSAANPWQSFAYVESQLTIGPNGTVVHVSGTYTMTCNAGDGVNCVTLAKGGTGPSAYLTYQGESGAHVHASGNQTNAQASANKANSQAPTCTASNSDCESGNGGTVIFIASTAPYLQISDLEIECTGEPETCQHGIVNYAQHVVISENDIHDIPMPQAFGAAVNSTSCPLGTSAPPLSTCGDVWIDGNAIHDIGLLAYSTAPVGIVRALDIGIYISAPFENARNNVIYNIPYGYCATYNHYPYKAIFMNNTCDGAGGAASNGNGNIGGGLNVSSEESYSVVDYVTAEDNIFSNIAATAVIEAYTGTGTLGPHNDFAPNLFFGNATNFEILKSPAPSCGTTAVCADPLFVVPGSDFHLQANSPAIDVGVTTCAPGSGIVDCAPATDKDGIVRPPGHDDLGAYEYQ